MDINSVVLIAICFIVPACIAVAQHLAKRRAERRAEEFMRQIRELEKELARMRKPPPEPEPVAPPRPFSVEDRGFREMAEVRMGFPMKFYWHPDLRMELALSIVAGTYVMKGMKKYYVKAMSESGHETWDRSLGTVMDILKTSFPEYHVYGCGVAHITKGMVRDLEAEVREEEKTVSAQEDLIRSLVQSKAESERRIREAMRIRAEKEGERQAQKEYDRERKQREQEALRAEMAALRAAQADPERRVNVHVGSVHVDYQADSRARMARDSARAQYEKETEEREQRRVNERITEAKRELDKGR